MSDSLLQFLPANLRARLLPGSADDAVNFIEVLEFHLKLQKNLGQPAQAVEPQDQPAQLQSLIDAFAAAPNATAILKIWQQVPQALEAAFILGVETSIAQEIQDGATEHAAGLRERLDELQQILAEQRALLTLPDDLSARLQQAMAGGSSLAQALELHPALLHDFATFIDQHQEQVAHVILRPLLADCMAATNGAELWQVWQRAPEELHDDMFTLLNDLLSTYEQNGLMERAEILQDRLAKLNELRDNQQQVLAHIRQWIAKMTEPLSQQALVDLLDAIPKELREIILLLAEEYAGELEQAGDTTTALRLRGQTFMLRSIQSIGSFVDETATAQALKAFFNAESDDEAQAVLTTHSKVLLTPQVSRWIREAIERSPLPHGDHAQVRARMLAERYRPRMGEVSLRHAKHYGELFQSADEQQQSHNIKEDIRQVRHAIEWALEHDITQVGYLLQSLIPLVDALGVFGEAPNWREYLGWCEQALAFANQHGTSADRASAQVLRGHAWQRIATLPNEDRRACLDQALAAYGQAGALLSEWAETTPFLMETRLNRAVVIKEISTLPGEDRRARLYDVLAIYDEALQIWSPDPSWHGSALLHSNRANLLIEIARLPGEDERARLYEALAAHEQALRFYALGDKPVSRAETLSNKAAVLLSLATIAGEDRRAHLIAALEVCDESLKVFLPNQHPMSYAMAQSHCGTALLELSRIPGEDRLAHLSEAAQAYEQALQSDIIKQSPLQHAHTLSRQANVFGDLAAIYTYQEAVRLHPGEQDPLKVQQFLGKANTLDDLAALVGEDRRTLLGRALRAAWTALSIFREVQHQPDVDDALALLRGLRLVCGDDFAAIWQEIEAGPPPDWGETYAIEQLLNILSVQVDLGALLAFWAKVPFHQREPLLRAVEERIVQAQHEADDLIATSLRQKLESIRLLGDVPPQLVWQSRQAAERYETLREAAYQDDRDAGGWQRVIAAGEAVRALAFDQNPALDRRAVCEKLADDTICLALAYKTAGDPEAMLEALERAVNLLPDAARVRAYYARGLMRLGRLKEAERELRVARRFDPNLRGLADLEAMLTEALKGKPD